MCIKKLLIALTLIFTLIIFSSCDGAQNSTSDQNTTNDDLKEDTNTDTNTDANIDTSQATDSEIVSDCYNGHKDQAARHCEASSFVTRPKEDI